jgi:hypothetical protein
VLVHKVLPRRSIVVEFEAVEPQMCIIQEMEGCVRHPFVIGGAANTEVVLAPNFRKVELVVGGQEVVGVVDFVGVVMSVSMRKARDRVVGYHVPLYLLAHVCLWGVVGTAPGMACSTWSSAKVRVC